MPSISIFDIFKIGVGPSSSHTLGSWKAASQFAKSLKEKPFTTIEVHLLGSLSKTGKGHATDIAIQLGLEEYLPESIDTANIKAYLHRIETEKILHVAGRDIEFDPAVNITFNSDKRPRHPNTVIFYAFNHDKLIKEETYYSVGGGFIEKKGKQVKDERELQFPFPIDNAKELLTYTTSQTCAISDIVFLNEASCRTPTDVDFKISAIYETMIQCVYLGCKTEGILPGGLLVKRRAHNMCKKLLGDLPMDDISQWQQSIKKAAKDFSTINRWVSCFAIAVNEENADLGRVVTSPTNGAAGVIPAVLLYHVLLCDNRGMEDVKKFLLTAGEIGCMFKKGATISAAVGGCQAEIGVSSAMAAGGLAEVMGGSPEQVLMAAEIAMEHHLGLTCDPIGGLVQIPCIERNSMGAIKAITASHLALSSDPRDAKVHFDVVVKTMWDTAKGMNSKYKETSEGGLAFNLPVIYPEC